MNSSSSPCSNVDHLGIPLGELRQAYAKGENIMQILNARYSHLSREESIEIAYDIQSGSYTDIANSNLLRLRSYAAEIGDLCCEYIFEGDTILDCGAGELTTLSALSQHLPDQARLLACDISLSRLRFGLRFAERFMRHDLAVGLDLFVADMGSMPLAEDSVDVVFTCHALEPNHGRERRLLGELLRIARRHLILFEPSWEHASETVRARMEQHGYIRELPRHIREAGGKLLSVRALPNPLNPDNPTYCYIVEVTNHRNTKNFPCPQFRCPRSGFPLLRRSNYLWSMEGGWAYPEIEEIPCLRKKHGVLMSHG
jgi:hypothetical protein